MGKKSKAVGILLLAAVIGVGIGLLRDWLADAREGSRPGAGAESPPRPQPPAEADRAPELAGEVAGLRAELAQARAQVRRAEGLEAELAAARQKAAELEARLASARKSAPAEPRAYAEPIFFGPGEAGLDSAGRRKVSAAVRAIQADPGRGVAVEGHSDSLPLTPPTKARFGDNLGLSVVRSLNVARELFRQGVALERVIVIGYGDTRPLQPAEAGQKVNSRRALVRRQMPRPPGAGG
jgi:chemotaxis protein MotB